MSNHNLTNEQIKFINSIPAHLQQITTQYFLGLNLNDLYSKVSLISYRKQLLRFGIDINKPLEK